MEKKNYQWWSVEALVRNRDLTVYTYGCEDLVHTGAVRFSNGEGMYMPIIQARGDTMEGVLHFIRSLEIYRNIHGPVRYAIIPFVEPFMVEAFVSPVEEIAKNAHRHKK